MKNRSFKYFRPKSSRCPRKLKKWLKKVGKWEMKPEDWTFRVDDRVFGFIQVFDDSVPPVRHLNNYSMDDPKIKEIVNLNPTPYHMTITRKSYPHGQ
jgi:hypothetical protein